MQRLLFLCWAGVLLCNAAASERRAEPKKYTESRQVFTGNVVVLETSLGPIRIELFADKAPLTVQNFLGYADRKFYDGTVFHRVIADFMIQGGGYEPGLKDKPTKEPIKNEAGNGLSNARGTIAMARTNQPDSATVQFYINLRDNVFLDKKNSRDGVGYCVFGKVIAGMEVVDRIAKVETGPAGGHQNVPKKDVVIRSVRRVR